MQEIPAKAEEEDKEQGANEPKLEVKTEEEADRGLYSSLLSPSEEVYAEAFYTSKPRQGSARLYCLISCLSVICLILFMVVIILGVKRDACTDCCTSSTKASPWEHVDPGVSLSSHPLTTTISAEVQAGSTVSSEKYKTGNNGKGPSMVGTERQCTEHLSTFYSDEEEVEIYRKGAGSEPCPYKWTLHGNYCFFLSTIRLSWEQSQSKCSSVCGSLAVITSQEVQNFLTKKGNLIYWIGLKKHQSVWQWVNNKTLEKSYWRRNPGDGDCALLKSTDPPEGNWIRGSCRGGAYFICQLEK